MEPNSAANERPPTKVNPTTVALHDRVKQSPIPKISLDLFSSSQFRSHNLNQQQNKSATHPLTHSQTLLSTMCPVDRTPALINPNAGKVVTGAFLKSSAGAKSGIAVARRRATSSRTQKLRQDIINKDNSDFQTRYQPLD